MTKCVASVSAILLAAGAAFADRPATGNGLFGGVPGNPNSGPSTLVSGFEAGDGFAVGPMPQNGWQSLTNLNAGLGNGASISNVNPFAGQQHLRLAVDASKPAGTPSGTQSPALGFGGAATTTSFKIFIPTDAYADYHMVGFTTTTSLAFSYHLNFSFTGSLNVLRSAADGGNVTGPAIAYNQWSDLVIAYNPTSNQMSVTYNGNNFYNGVGGFGAGFGQTAYDAFAAYSDNFQDPGEAADIDNFAVVPAPGSLALLGMGGLFAARRRRA